MIYDPLNLRIVGALMDTAEQTLRDQIAGEKRRDHKWGLKRVLDAVVEARSLAINQELNREEVRAWRLRLARKELASLAA